MNRNVHTQIADQRGVDIRNPSTANLFINSTDRTGGNIGPLNNAVYFKDEATMNGFFTRLAVQEIILSYNGYNISDGTLNNAYLEFFVQAFPAVVFTAFLEDGNYTVKDLLDKLVASMNEAMVIAGHPTYVLSMQPNDFGTGYGIALAVAGVPANWSLDATSESSLNEFIRFSDPYVFSSFHLPVNPDLRPFYFLDFVSSQLTYNQEVKDGTTQPENRDVMYRWYFAWDDSGERDAYGYPILQGYLPFVQRRCIAFPKQIKWSPNQPIGGLQIDIYDSTGSLVEDAWLEYTEYQFTLLASEV